MTKRPRVPERKGQAASARKASDEPEKGWFGQRSVRVWTVMAGVVGTLALIAAVIQLVPKDSEPELQLVDYAVHDPGSVDGIVKDESGREAPTTQKVDTNTIDIRLRNTGEQPALITSIEVDVLYAEQMQDCEPSGGGVRASAEYTLKIPEEPPTRPFHLSQPISFEVKAKSLDRFTATLGPRDQWLSSPTAWLYVAKISLRQGTGGETIPVGNAAVIARPGNGLKIAQQTASDWACHEYNAALIEQVFRTPAKRSAELDQIRAHYSQVLNPSVAATATEPVCVAASSKAAEKIRRVCIRYTKKQLSASFELTSDAKAEITQVMLRMRPTPQGPAWRWVSWFRGDQWSVGFPEPDTSDDFQWAGNGCGPCSAEGGARSVTITYETPPDMTATSWAVTAELLDVTTRTKPKVVDQLPSGGAVEVTRGP